MYASHKFKILTVDDDIQCLDALERVLRKDYQVFRAGNGLEAIHILDREGEMAVAIVDLNMPVVDGVEFLFGMISAFPNTVRIVLTAGREIDYLLTAVNDLRLFRYMLKPFNREELLIIVKQAVELYQMQAGKSYRVPPAGVLQFSPPPLSEDITETLVVEIDQSLREQQVAEILSSDIFTHLTQTKETPTFGDTTLLQNGTETANDRSPVPSNNTNFSDAPSCELNILDSEEFRALERQSEEFIARITTQMGRN